MRIWKRLARVHTIRIVCLLGRKYLFYQQFIVSQTPNRPKTNSKAFKMSLNWECFELCQVELCQAYTNKLYRYGLDYGYIYYVEPANTFS